MVDCDLPSGKEMDREIDSMRRSLAPASSSGKQTNEEVDISARKSASKEACAITRMVYDSLKGGVFGFGTDEHALLSSLRKLPTAELARIYSDHYKRDLFKDLSRELSGADKAEAIALLQGDRMKADALGIVRAARMGNSSGDEICSMLEYHLHRGDLKGFKADFESRFSLSLSYVLKGQINGPKLHNALALADGCDVEWARPVKQQTFNDVLKHLHSKDRAEALRLKQRGELTTAHDLLYSLKAGQDIRAKEILRAVPQDQMQSFKDEYAKVDALGLQKRIAKETSGRTLLDLQDIAVGPASSPEELISRHKERYKHEKSGLFGTITNVLSNKDNLAETDLRRLDQIVKEAGKDGMVTEGESRRIAEMAEYVDGDVRFTYPQAKESVRRDGLGLIATGAGAVLGPAGIPVAAVLRPVADWAFSGDTFDRGNTLDNIITGAEQAGVAALTTIAINGTGLVGTAREAVNQTGNVISPPHSLGIK